MTRRQPFACLTILPDQSGVAFSSSYDPGLIAALKATIPPSGRRWDRANKRWIVAPEYARVCADLARRYLGITVEVQQALLDLTPTLERRNVVLEYLGRARWRGGDEPTAYGFVDGEWSFIFPLSTLRAFFDPEGKTTRPDESPTLYARLGVSRRASVDEIRRAYRRAARQWHPDVCKEPDAAEQFKLLAEAYRVLTDEEARRRYDAALALTTSVRGTTVEAHGKSWVPPLRCGMLTVDGYPKLGRFYVTRIMEWQDIVDHQGRMMVTYWPKGAETFEVMWV